MRFLCPPWRPWRVRSAVVSGEFAAFHVLYVSPVNIVCVFDLTNPVHIVCYYVLLLSSVYIAVAISMGISDSMTNDSLIIDHIYDHIYNQ